MRESPNSEERAQERLDEKDQVNFNFELLQKTPGEVDELSLAEQLVYWRHKYQEASDILLKMIRES